MPTRRTVILATLLSLIPRSSDARRKHKRRRHKRKHRPAPVVVRDYTSPAWDGLVAQTVADFNAMLPRNAPRLLYRREGEGPCPSGAPEGIVVCHDPDEAHPAMIWGLMRARLLPRHEASVIRQVAFLSHEMMHITTGIPDNYGARPDTSCVWGWLDRPGPFDAEYARTVWRKKAKRDQRH